MAFKYQSGEDIEKGDRITLFEKPGRIEFVVTGIQDDPSDGWYVRQYGGGIMIFEHEEFGRLFLQADELNIEEYEYKNLKFVSRGRLSREPIAPGS